MADTLSTAPPVPSGIVRVAAGGTTRTGRKVRVLAYAGGVAWPAGWQDTLMVLSGMELPATVPLLADHDNTLGGLVGQGRPMFAGDQLIVAGELSVGGLADRAAALLADGVSVQASVGVMCLSVPRYLQPGDKITANGRTFTAGPFGLTVCDKTRLMEVSLVAVAGDPFTSVTITAKGTPMLTATATEPVLTAAAGGPPLPPPGPDPVQAERDRVERVMVIADAYPDIRAAAVREGWAVDRTQAATLKRIRDSRPLPPESRGGDGGRAAAAVGPNQLAAAILCRAGHAAAAEVAYPGLVGQLGRLRSASLPDLCAAALQFDGREVPHDRSQMIRAAVSTGSMPTALGEAARVTLEQAYKVQPATWRAWCAVRPAVDFRDHQTVRPNFLGELTQVPPSGEIKHGTYGAADAIAWRVDTFAKLLKVDRRTIINDDLQAFAEILPGFARTAARTLGDLVYKTLLLNTGSFFSVINNNLLTGAGSALSVAGLTAAIKTLRTHRDVEGNDLDILPVTLMVPPELETVARQLLASEALARDGTADQQPTGNPHAGGLALQVEPRLSNPKFSGSSATAWYVFAGPADVPGVVGFLDGNQTPRTETFGFDAEPDTLAASYRVYHDFGFSLGDPVAAVKSAGA